MNPIVQLIIGEVPSIIALIQQRHADANPSAPPLTPQQIADAFEEAFTSTIAKDEMIKAILAAS